jgi:nucleoside-diphosphate kinase
MAKPDCVQRGLVGEVVSRFERKGFKLVGMKMMTISRELAMKHYDIHKEKPFFNDLVNFITSGPVVAMAWEGESVISAGRALVGATNPLVAACGTIRGDYGVLTTFNLIHGSDGPETAMRELGLFFEKDELTSYPRDIDRWVSK